MKRAREHIQNAIELVKLLQCSDPKLMAVLSELYAALTALGETKRGTR